MAPAATSSAIARTSPEKYEIDKKMKEQEKKSVNEIEEIFRVAKNKRKELRPSPSSSVEKKANKKSPKKKIKKVSKNSGEERSSRKRKKTTDGLSIYSAEELGVGNPDAGGTALCPFECSCCY